MAVSISAAVISFSSPKTRLESITGEEKKKVTHTQLELIGRIKIMRFLPLTCLAAKTNFVALRMLINLRRLQTTEIEVRTVDLSNSVWDLTFSTRAAAAAILRDHPSPAKRTDDVTVGMRWNVSFSIMLLECVDSVICSLNDRYWCVCTGPGISLQAWMSVRTCERCVKMLQRGKKRKKGSYVICNFRWEICLWSCGCVFWSDSVINHWLRNFFHYYYYSDVKNIKTPN